MLCRNGITGYKKDETTKMEEMHQQKVEQMIKSAEGSAGRLHRITKPKLWRRRSTVLGERRGGCEVVGLLCGKKEKWSIHWQCDEEVQNTKDKPWRRCEEALPRLKEGDLESASRMYKAKTG